MLLGQALIEAGVLTEAHIQKALQAQSRYPNLTFSEVISKLFGIPRDVVESHYINRSIIPFIKEWLQKQMDNKEFSDGFSAGSTIADIAITVPTFTRYEDEAVRFDLIADGMYKGGDSLTRMERILATIDPLVITTTRQQKIIVNDVNLELSLEEKRVRPDNPGFLSEVKLRLLKAFKQES